MLLHCVALLLKGGRRNERSGGKRHILNYSLKWVKANLMEDENCVHLLFTKSFFNLIKGWRSQTSLFLQVQYLPHRKMEENYRITANNVANIKKYK